jgi:nicotinamidase-related amidase
VRGIDTVTIAGYMTHMCCDTTARQAVHRGFKSEFLSDATGTLPLSNAGGEVTAEELQRSILAAQAQLLSEVLPADRWIERL